jgi:flagellar protein FlbD
LIRLTRLNSQPITVNSDLIKFVESNPDTVITLVNGDKILVHETSAEVVERVIAFRRAVISGSASIADPAAGSAAQGRAQLDCDAPPPPPEGRSRG